MAPRDAIRILAFGRIAIGVSTLMFPRLAMGSWVGRQAHTAAMSVAGRALGVRDAIFGGMLLHTLDHPQVAQRWAATCGACDVVDGVAALNVRSELPPVRGLAGTLLALGSGAAHLALSRQLAAGEQQPPAA